MRVGRTDTMTDWGSSEEDVYKEGGRVPFDVNNIGRAIREGRATMNNGQSSKTFVCL